MSTYEDTLLAARFAALAPEPLAGDWEDILARAGRARKGRRPFAASFQGRRRRQLVVLAAVALVVVVGAASALAVRAYVFHQGIVGLPPVGATPSTPTRGELVLHFMFGHSMGDPGRFSVFVYADGRLITERIGDYSLARTDEHRNSTGRLERRLTPEGVERVRAEVISTGLFDHDLHLTSGRGLTFGYVAVPTTDQLVQVIWGDISWEGVDPNATREYPTPEQANALIRLDERLADPTSWLPASAWADPRIKPYVPPGYSVCYQGPRGLRQSQALALLPPAAQDFLRIKDTRQEEYTNLAGRLVYWCSDLTNDESRALARILDSAGLKGHEDVFGLTYGAYQREIGDPRTSGSTSSRSPHTDNEGAEMRARDALLVTVAAAAAMTSLASAGADATKQRVQIDMKFPAKSTFVLTPLQTGALERDSGTHSCTEEADPRDVLRYGQEAFLWECRALVLTGKRGTLVLRSRFAWVEAGGPYNIATGTWKVARGTGQYARVTGSGRSADVGTPSMRLTRYQGFLTSP